MSLHTSQDDFEYRAALSGCMNIMLML